MNTFNKFCCEVPTDGSATIGEIDLKIFNVKSENDKKLTEYIKKKGELFPFLSIPKEKMKIKNPNEILNKPKSSKKRRKKDGIFTRIYQKLVYFFGFIVLYIPYLQILFSARIEPQEEKEPEITWKDTCFEFAVVLEEGNAIYFYDMNSRKWNKKPLKDKRMKKITCIKFRPNDPEVIAVGCRNGVFIWNLKQYFSGNFDLKKKKNSSLLRTYLCHNSPIDRIEWTKDGKTITASSILDHRIIIWKFEEKRNRFSMKDILSNFSFPSMEGFSNFWRWLTLALGDKDQFGEPLNKITSRRKKSKRESTLKRRAPDGWNKYFITRFNGGVDTFSYSPDGAFLIVFYNCGVIRIFETKEFNCCVKWKSRSKVICHQWTTNSEYLFYASEGDDHIKTIKFDKRVKSKVYAKKGTRINLQEFKTKGISVCGEIKMFKIDSTGERMVVGFKNSPLLGVLKIDFDSIFETNRIIPLGFIKTYENSIPLSITFWNRFSKGSLCSVLYSNGRVSFYPLYFK